MPHGSGPPAEGDLRGVEHGIAFRATDKMNMDNEKWVVGEDYYAAPTSDLPHVGDTQSEGHARRRSAHQLEQPSGRLDSTRGLRCQDGPAGADIDWKTRRANMKDVCVNCHNANWVDNWYVQADALIDLYNDKYAKPGKALYAAAKPPEAGQVLEQAGLHLVRARNEVVAPAMAHLRGPGLHPLAWYVRIAKHFYAKYIPELENLIEKGRASGDEKKIKAADELEKLIEATLNSDDHKWYLDKLDPEEKEARAKAAEEFRARYSD